MTYNVFGVTLNLAQSIMWSMSRLVWFELPVESIPSGPTHCAHNNTTTMQYETKTRKIYTDKHQ